MPAYTIQRYPDAPAFLDAAGDVLLRQEAANCLILGVCHAMAIKPPDDPGKNYHAAVLRDGEVIGGLMRTPPFKLAVSTLDLPPDDLPGVAEAIVQATREQFGDLPGVIGPSANARAVAQAWTGGDDGWYIDMAERVYRLDELIEPDPVPGGARPADDDDRDLLEHWARGFFIDAFGVESNAENDPAAFADRMLAGPPEVRGAWLWEVDDEPVSMACHTGPTPNGKRIGPVYTPRDQRGHGYGTAITAALTRHLLASGRSLTFLFTDLANPTSNAIYQRIGYRPVVDVDSIAFGDAAISD